VPYAVAALVAAITAAVGLAILVEARPTPTGDEPHYLLIAQSIALDGDIDLANDYADPERVAAAYPGNTVLDPVTHAGVYRDGGPTVPIHAVGLPLVLAPVYALGQGWIAARVLMVLISALTAGLAYLVVDRLVPRRPVLSALSVLAVSLTVPGIAFANQIYPEIPAALVLTAASFCLVRGRPTLPWLVAASVLGALAPWIHLRFAILVLPIGLAVVGRALGMPLGVVPVDDAAPAGALLRRVATYVPPAMTTKPSTPTTISCVDTPARRTPSPTTASTTPSTTLRMEPRPRTVSVCMLDAKRGSSSCSCFSSWARSCCSCSERGTIPPVGLRE